MKPSGGTNVVYWYSNDDSAGSNNRLVCLYWRLNGSSTWTNVYYNPGLLTQTYNPLTPTPPTCNYGNASEPLSLAVSAAAGSTIDYCAKEWVFIASVWSRSANPVSCVRVVFDTTAPTGSLSMSAANGSTTYTNSPNGWSHALTYQDDYAYPRSQAWVGAASTQGANSLCTSTAGTCIPGVGAFERACSLGTTGIVVSFASCVFDYAGSDGNITRCFRLFSGADLDQVPSNLQNNPGTTADDLPANQVVPATPTGDSAHVCDSLVLDRVAPTGTAQVTSASVQTGTSVTASIAPADDRSGVAATSWTVTGGAGATGTSVARSFATAGTYTFTATVTDGAGNTHQSSTSVTVTAPTTPPPTGGTGGQSGGGTGGTPGGTTGGSTGGTTGGTTGGATGGTNPDGTPAPTLRNTVKPKVTGTRRVGKVLTCAKGTWTPARGVAFTYAWKRGTAVIRGAARATYTLTNADKGKRLTCVVTGKLGTKRVAATSLATTAILARA